MHLFKSGISQLYKKLKNDTRGGVIIYTAILLPTIVGFVGLGVDVALWHVAKRQTQAIADAAAIDGALEILRVKNSPDVMGSAMGGALSNGYEDVVENQIIINSPPTSGAFSSNSKAVEVIVRVPSPRLLSGLIDDQDHWISSRAVGMGDMNNTCLWALEPLAPSAISISGGSTVNFTCGVFSNSVDPAAINMNGNGSCISGSEIKAVGGVTAGCVDPPPVTGVLPLSDPLESLPPPVSTGCTYNGNVMVNGSQNAVLSPGTYCGNIAINTSGNVTFQPGVYYMQGSGLSIGAHATVSGSGVTIYMAPGGQTSDDIKISSGANVSLEAPETGVYSGILIYKDKDSNANAGLSLLGGAYMDLAGIIYAPAHEVLFSGGSLANSSNSTIISNTIKFSGNSHLAEFTPAARRVNPLLVEARLVE